jgi:hypothetical protein
VDPVGGEEPGSIGTTGSRRKHKLAQETASGSIIYDCAIARRAEDDGEGKNENTARREE